MNRRTTITLAIGGLLLGFGLDRARGSLITWEFGGEVQVLTDFKGLLGDSVMLGTPFSGSFTFDTSTSDSLPDDPTNGFYPGALISLSGVVGNLPFALTSPIDITVLNDNGVTSLRDQFDFVGSTSLMDRLVSSSLILLFEDTSVFATDRLPLELPPLEGLIAAKFGLNSQGEGVFVEGDLTRLVPEPGTLFILGFASTLLLRRRRVRTDGRKAKSSCLLFLCAFVSVCTFGKRGYIMRPMS